MQGRNPARCPLFHKSKAVTRICQRSRVRWPRPTAKRLMQLEHNNAIGPLVRMDRDIHGFVAVPERVGKPIVLQELDAAQADVTFDHGER